MVRDIRITVEDNEFSELKQTKGDRSWREAILEEFGVTGDNDE